VFKIWIDDTRPKPVDYDFICNSVNEAIAVISGLPETAKALIDLDHDAGDFAVDGGDYIRILDYIEQFDLNSTGRFCFRIHSMNIVGRQNMMRIINRRGWKYIY